MGLFRLLFNRKHFDPTPVPNDWPPDESMHFLRLPIPNHLSLPDHFAYFEFAPNAEEGDPIAADLGLKILKALCCNKAILTDIHSWEKSKKQHKRSAETFPEYYSPVSLCRATHLLYSPHGRNSSIVSVPRL